MTELAGFADGADWLPDRVRRAQAIEAQREAREGRDAERARQERADTGHDRALAAYRAGADQRGEEVTAMALATGQDIGRTLGDVLGDAQLAAEREDGRATARERHQRDDVEYIGGAEPRIHASRSDWPESEYELGRMIREAQDSRSWIAGYRTRVASRRGQAAEHIEAERAAARRAHEGDVYRGQPMISR